jgi:hypothetical protein
MNTNRLMVIALGSLLLAAPAYLAAQDQGQESVADAARKAQAAKKNAPKSKLSIDNDNLDTLTGSVSVVGQAPAPPPTDDAKKPGAPGAKAPANDEAYWRAKFAAANKKLSDDEHELDITQREYNLKQQQFYTDPMAALKQDYSRQDLNDTKTKIDQKTADVAQDKSDISNLEDELRQAGGDPGWARPSDRPVATQPASATEPAPDSAPAPAAAPAPAPQP